MPAAAASSAIWASTGGGSAAAGAGTVATTGGASGLGVVVTGVGRVAWVAASSAAVRISLGPSS